MLLLLLLLLFFFGGGGGQDGDQKIVILVICHITYKYKLLPPVVKGSFTCTSRQYISVLLGPNDLTNTTTQKRHCGLYLLFYPCFGPPSPFHCCICVETFVFHNGDLYVIVEIMVS